MEKILKQEEIDLLFRAAEKVGQIDRNRSVRYRARARTSRGASAILSVRVRNS
jgi:hypothetical protein